MRKWLPQDMLEHIDKTKQPIVKARVQSGGDSGTVAVFIGLDNKRFAYSMPSVEAGVTAIEAMVASHPERFPLRQTSASDTRAVYKRLSRQL